MISKLLVGVLAVLVVSQTAGPASAGSVGTVARVRAAGAVIAAAPVSATDPSKIPHYFGPYPNWANSPQVLADAIVSVSLGTPTPVSFGNPLTERANATDYATPPGTLGPVFVVLPHAPLPAGTLQIFQIWNQGTPGASPTTSAGNLFHAYVLRPTGAANAYTVLYDSGQLTVPVPTVATGEVATFATPGVPVLAGDVLGFYGEGIPVDTGVTLNPDILSYPATADSTLLSNLAPAATSTVTLGVDAGFPLYSQDRTYSFAASVTPPIPAPARRQPQQWTRRRAPSPE